MGKDFCVENVRVSVLAFKYVFSRPVNRNSHLLVLRMESNYQIIKKKQGYSSPAKFDRLNISTSFACASN